MPVFTSPQTPAGSTTPYCTGQQLTQHCDWRPIADLVSDTNKRVYASADQVASDPIVSTCLMTASGMVESACLLGDRYTATDLQSLTGASLNMLQWITAKIALVVLIGRRPDALFKIPEDCIAVIGEGGWLDKLRAGERIFSLQESMDAGLMEFHTMTEPEILRRGLATTQARRYFGQRAQDRCWPGGGWPGWNAYGG